MGDWRCVGRKMVRGVVEPLSNIPLSPNMVSWLSVYVSLLAYFLLKLELYALACIVILLVLLFDALDGLIARKRKLASFRGLVVDVSCDRISEFIIFLPYKLWLLLACFNVYLTVLRLKDKRVYILPLRHVFLAILALLALGVGEVKFLLV